MTIIAEGGDLRQYRQAPQFMASIGIVPGEDSTGERQKRGSITKTGNVYLRRILIEAGWSYQRRPHAGVTIQKRRRNQPEALLAIARKADHRLHGKFSKLQFRYNKTLCRGQCRGGPRTGGIHLGDRSTVGAIDFLRLYFQRKEARALSGGPKFGPGFDGESSTPPGGRSCTEPAF